MDRNLCVLMLAALWACSPGETSTLEVQAGSLVFAEESGSGCVTPMSRRGALPSDADRMVVHVVRESDSQVVATRVIVPQDLLQQRDFLIPGVPEGRYRLRVTGCGGALPIWGGESGVFAVSPGFKSAPIVHLLRAGALNCIGGKNQNPLQPKFDGDGFYVSGRAAFQGAVVTASGRVFLTGGFTKDEFQVSGDVLTAGRRVWEYQPETGVFTGVFSPSGERLEIAEPRAGHGMAAVTVGATEHLVLAGGVSSAVLGPAQFPVSLAPLDLPGPIQSAFEVVTIPGAGSSASPSARSLAIRHGGGFPSWTFSSDGRVAVLVGGKEAGGVSRAVTVMTLSDEVLAGTSPPHVRTGTLQVARYGASVVRLSSGDIVAIGGSNGSGYSGIEWVRLSGDDSVESIVVPVGLPVEVQPTAFSSIAVVQDDGRRAALLILGGTPLPGGATAYADVVSPNPWLLEVDGDGQAYDPTSIRVRAISGAGEWAARSMASVVHLGDRFLLVGGLRSFNAELTVAGCGSGGPVWGAYCFPRTIAEFSFDPSSATLTLRESMEDIKSRLGAAPLHVRGRGVLVVGGVNGYGTRPSPLPADFDPLLSTGVIVVPEDAFDPAPCQDSSIL